MVTEVAVLGGRREPLRQGTRRPEAVRKRAVAVPAVARGASKHTWALTYLGAKLWFVRIYEMMSSTDRFSST